METRTRSKRGQTARSALDLLVSLALLGASVAVISAHLGRPAPVRRSPEMPKEPLSLSDLPTKGNTESLVAILWFSDYQCPSCARFATDVLPAIEQKYVLTGRVFLAYRNLPLADIHPLATKAAEAAECARRQGRFWEAHNKLLLDGARIAEMGTGSIADSISLDGRKFERCMAGEATARVQEDVAEARRLGVTGTPSFIIGNLLPDGRLQAQRVLVGARPFSEFSRAIDAVLDGTTRWP